MATPTPAQLRAIQHTDGPCVIIAGAGTGKTTTMQQKIEHLLQQGVLPERILALTFSEAAKGELRKKLEGIAGSSRVVVSTFHGYSLHLVEEHNELLGISGNITALKEEDVALLLFENDVNAYNAKRYSNTIIKAKDNNITKEQYGVYVAGLKAAVSAIEPDESRWQTRLEKEILFLRTYQWLPKNEQKLQKPLKEAAQEFIQTHADYEKYHSFLDAWNMYDAKKPKNALDFPDMQRLAVELLHVHSTKLLPALEHVIIDEFQDTSFVQFELITLIAEKTRNITIVGDRNQSIYAFRGAFTDNVDEFLEYFNLTKDAIIPLDASFRSTQHILDASHNLILNNYPEKRKEDCVKLTSYSGDAGEKVRIVDCEDDMEEARAIAERIQGLLRDGTPHEEIAVLYRKGAYSDPLQAELLKRKIPFSITSSQELFHQRHIKTILAYLYVLAHLRKPLSTGTQFFWRLFHFNDSLSHEDTHTIGSYLKTHSAQFSDIIYATPADLQITTQGKEVIARVKRRLERLDTTDTLREQILSIMDSTGLSRSFSSERSVENIEAMMHLRDFYAFTEEFSKKHGDDIQKFINYIELLDEIETTPTSKRQRIDGAVQLMTMHGAKGLEFDHVFLLAFYEGKFPLLKGGVEPLIPPELNPQLKLLFTDGVPDEDTLKKEKKRRKLEEERRVCYVAMTRAKKHLTISLGRQFNGKDMNVSEFLHEIGYTDQRDRLVEEELEHAVYVPDKELLSQPLAPAGPLEEYKSHHKRLLLESIDAEPHDAVRELMHYMGLRGVPSEQLTSLSTVVPHEDIKRELAEVGAEKKHLHFDPSSITFSYSGIKAYATCPKYYELSQVLRMPKRQDDDVEAPTSVGSFVHEILETAVKKNITGKEKLYELVDTIASQEKWHGVDTARAKHIMDVFWERNADKMNVPHRVEEWVTFTVEGIKFHGKIDRVDIAEDGVEIIDYKTGKNEPEAEERARQLSMYAYGVKQDWGLTPKFLTLDLLEQEKMRRFELSPDGNATMPRITFNIHESMQEMVAIAKQALKDYESGFKPTTEDKPCETCPYKMYCPKWG